tara:strand:- start:983 stop:1297 length:315 start_codon:yes stop_codon:yes gene_type:complete
MALEVCRETDPLDTGHGCDSTTTLATPSQSTVFAEGLLVARKTDPTVSHEIEDAEECASHTAQVNVGDTTVFTVGLATARVTDSTDQGQMTDGASTVFAEGPAG